MRFVASYIWENSSQSENENNKSPEILLSQSQIEANLNKLKPMQLRDNKRKQKCLTTNNQ